MLYGYMKANLHIFLPLFNFIFYYFPKIEYIFIFTDTKGKLEKMISNAVPVNLANHVAKSIIAFMEDFESGKIKVGGGLSGDKILRSSIFNK